MDQDFDNTSICMSQTANKKLNFYANILNTPQGDAVRHRVRGTATVFCSKLLKFETKVT